MVEREHKLVDREHVLVEREYILVEREQLTFLGSAYVAVTVGCTGLEFFLCVRSMVHTAPMTPLGDI